MGNSETNDVVVNTESEDIRTISVNRNVRAISGHSPCSKESVLDIIGATRLLAGSLARMRM